MTGPARRTSSPDGGHRVPLTDWGALVEHLDEFCRGGKFTAGEERAVCEFANAQVIVTRDGRVETGMPLHAFQRDGVETLLLDHDSGELTVATGADDERLEYTFHRP